MKTIELRISERTYKRLRTTLMTRAMSMGGDRARAGIIEAVCMKIMQAYENDEPVIELKAKDDQST